MWKYEKRREALIRQIEGVRKALDSGDKDNADHADHTETLAVLEEDLKILESDALLEKAARFNLDLTNTAGVGPWMTHAVKPGRTWLEKKSYAAASKAISEARRAWYKQWIDLLSPVASVIIAIGSTLISLLALVLAAVALYLQLIGRLH